MPPAPPVPPRPQSPFLNDMLTELHSFWTPARLSTLSKIATHCRQFEAWWKWELATHLWDLAGHVGADVFIESNGRADITLATPQVIGGGITAIDPTGPLCVPIELKTTGTWWGSTPSLIGKALAEPRKKRLADDLVCLAGGLARQARPFGIVAFLLTDHTGDTQVVDDYVSLADQLGTSAGVPLVLSTPLPLPTPYPNRSALAHLMIWAH